MMNFKMGGRVAAPSPPVQDAWVLNKKNRQAESCLPQKWRWPCGDPNTLRGISVVKDCSPVPGSCYPHTHQSICGFNVRSLNWGPGHSSKAARAMGPEYHLPLSPSFFENRCCSSAIIQLPSSLVEMDRPEMVGSEVPGGSKSMEVPHWSQPLPDPGRKDKQIRDGFPLKAGCGVCPNSAHISQAEVFVSASTSGPVYWTTSDYKLIQNLISCPIPGHPSTLPLLWKWQGWCELWSSDMVHHWVIWNVGHKSRSI